MNKSDCNTVVAMIGKLFPTVTPDQLVALAKRLPELPIDLEQAAAALDEEVLNPSPAKIGRVAAVWDRLRRAGAPTSRPESEGWRPPQTFGEVLQAQQKSGERSLSLVQKYIWGIQARCRERFGEAYARHHAWKHWTIWRTDLIDAGMGADAATVWLTSNTEVEQAWVDDLARRVDAGRAKQVDRMRTLAERWAAEDKEAA